MDDMNKKEIIYSMINSEFKPEIVEYKKVNLSAFECLPIKDLALLGSSFMPLIDSLNTLTSQVSKNASSNEFYAKIRMPKGSNHLAKARGGYIGAAFDSGNHLVGQARISPIDPPTNAINQIGTTPPVINPYMIAVGAMLLNINMKLDSIKQGQEKLMRFLEQKEKAKLEGNLKFLSDAINNYKFNWNNDNYKSVNHIKVLDIKQESEQSIALFKKQVSTILDENGLFHTTSSINNSINELLSKFHDYNLSIYLYSFASYIDVLLLENFDSDFLKRIIGKIQSYSLEYRETYTKISTVLERYSKKSLRSTASRGTAGLLHAIGKAVEVTPLLNKTKIDESLLNKSDTIAESDQTTNKEIAKKLVECKNVEVLPFVDGMKQIDDMYNNPMVIFIAKDKIFLSTSQTPLD